MNETPPDTALRERILDTALELAELDSWEGVRLHQVAAHLGCGLADIQRHFREKEEIAEAWFDRADRAMLAADVAAGLPVAERWRDRLLAWLEALAPHHRVTRQMILVKLEPGHLHVQIPALLRISRTVQWLREAAGIRDRLPRRAVTEAAQSAVFVAAFARWLARERPEREATARFLDRRLAELARLGLI